MNTRLIHHLSSALAVLFTSAAPLFAHCDTLDGPVIGDARLALAHNNPTPVLKWVAPDDEREIREAFARTSQVRRLSPEAQSLADRWFFETLVRVHRASEGEAFSGIKETSTDPVVAAADDALARGDIEKLVGHALQHVAAELRVRFERVREASEHRDESVSAGRAWVAAYVEFMHFAERLVGVPGEEPAAEHHRHES